MNFKRKAFLLHYDYALPSPILKTDRTCYTTHGLRLNFNINNKLRDALVESIIIYTGLQNKIPTLVL